MARRRRSIAKRASIVLLSGRVVPMRSVARRASPSRPCGGGGGRTWRAASSASRRTSGNVEYVGVDVSEVYIAQARRQLGDRGSFRVGDATRLDPDLGTLISYSPSAFSITSTTRRRRGSSQQARGALRGSGRLVTLDNTASRRTSAHCRPDRLVGPGGSGEVSIGLRAARASGVLDRRMHDLSNSPSDAVHALRARVRQLRASPGGLSASPSCCWRHSIGVLVLRAPLMNNLAYRDPWFYSGYGWTLEHHIEIFGWFYYSVRFPVTLPIRWFTDLFGPVTGALLLRYVLLAGTGAVFYMCVRRFASVGVAAVSTLFSGDQPVLRPHGPLGLHVVCRPALRDRRSGDLVHGFGAEATVLAVPRQRGTLWRGGICQCVFGRSSAFPLILVEGVAAVRRGPRELGRLARPFGGGRPRHRVALPRRLPRVQRRTSASSRRAI